MRKPQLINSAVVAALSKNLAAVSRFPFLKPVVKTVKVGCCGKTRRETQPPDANRTKAAIAGLSSTDQKVLLGFLGWSSARVTYSVSGKSVEKELGS